MQKLVKYSGFANANSARANWAPLKKRILEMAGEDGLTIPLQVSGGDNHCSPFIIINTAIFLFFLFSHWSLTWFPSCFVHLISLKIPHRHAFTSPKRTFSDQH